MLLDSVARLVTDGPAAAAPVLRQLVDSFVPGDLSGDEGLRWGRVAAVLLWDDDAGQTIMDRNIRQARAAGALEHLPLFLVPLAMSAGWRGDFAAAASLTAEGDSIAEATGVSIAPYDAMFVAALRGNQAELTRLIETTIAEAELGARPPGRPVRQAASYQGDRWDRFLRAASPAPWAAREPRQLAAADPR